MTSSYLTNIFSNCKKILHINKLLSLKIHPFFFQNNLRHITGELGVALIKSEKKNIVPDNIKAKYGVFADVSLQYIAQGFPTSRQEFKQTLNEEKNYLVKEVIRDILTPTIISAFLLYAYIYKTHIHSLYINMIKYAKLFIPTPKHNICSKSPLPYNSEEQNLSFIKKNVENLNSCIKKCEFSHNDFHVLKSACFDNKYYIDPQNNYKTSCIKLNRCNYKNNAGCSNLKKSFLNKINSDLQKNTLKSEEVPIVSNIISELISFPECNCSSINNEYVEASSNPYTSTILEYDFE